MFSLSECKYYAPCGLCTFYNTECEKQRKIKSKEKRSCVSNPDKPNDKLMDRIRSGEGLPPLIPFQIDEHNLPPGLRIDRRG
jgi:hypothetical protein